ncbi:cytochrome b [Salinisphaera sp. LB1]|uniref:cytochrome b n=1 Tax=Salinisphaera sp. LB1 TaxID=2183911 RepID=UPI000D707068|nr:cytochrome b/b6 domain-containing protein [Salinisphaera sp. LB1]
MNVETRQHHYHPAAKAFHWLVAVLVFVLWPLGLLGASLHVDATKSFFFWHEALGVTVFWLMLARLCVRFLTDTPAKPAGMPAGLASLAYLNQWLLYLALICQPIIGYILVTDHGSTYMWFGAVPIPSLVGKAPGIDHFVADLHTYLGWTILVLVGLHLLGMLYHRVIRQDDTLARMT